MSRLTPDRFEEFFRALRPAQVARETPIEPVRPFPWQRRLAARVAAAADPARTWPQALALPTASGKTACLDIAIFALACQAHLSPEARTAARRIFFVVDRRVIVDEAFAHAQGLAAALRGAQAGILREVADALRRVAGDPGPGGPLDPLACFQLRGGVYRDDAWARTPTQPTVVASTVDQLGSRLLFRGYGVTEGMRPIHAGLAANDSLVILDEAHCAQPCMETLLAVGRYRRWGNQPPPAPFHVVLLSATPPPELTDVEPAREDDRADPVLGRRLRARKPARLVVAAKAAGRDAPEHLARALAAEALALAKPEESAANPSTPAGPKAVAVIVNRVATARAVHDKLVKANAGDAVLLTGRMRPVDRDALVGEWRTRLGSGAAADRALPQTVFVVATQCLEVGADLDFDALVSECAALDSLRQRFGRLNRTGRPITAHAVILVRADQTEPAARPEDADPIYGDALPRTWQWLCSRAVDGTVNFGVETVRALLEADFAADPDALAALLAPAPHAPILLPAYVDCWGQTSPTPCPDPDTALFLHGPRRGAADVHVCWRADLPGGVADAETWREIVSFCPPSSAEAMPVPYRAMRRWLAGEDTPDATGGDVEGGSVEEGASGASKAAAAARVALRWLGPEASELVNGPEDLRPGDTLVLPAAGGGWSVLGHVPNGAAGIDVGDAANLRARARPILRLHPALLADWPAGSARERLEALLATPNLAENLDEPEFVSELRAALAELAGQAATPEWLRDLTGAFSESRRTFRISLYPSAAEPSAFALRGSKRLPKYSRRVETHGDEDVAVNVSLRAHTADVVAKVSAFTAACALPPGLAGDLRLAARLHDLGKADRRFQALMRGGEWRGGGEHLAKSDRLPAGWRAYVAARERAGYPAGGGHELVSTRLAECADDLLAAAADRELVLHLIVSHHGACRPFAPVIADPTPVEVTAEDEGRVLTASSRTGLERLDAGVPERFWRLTRRYGWWGLAYLEMVLRLADHRASQEEQRRGEDTD